MLKPWKSKKLYEHPAKYWPVIYGKVKMFPSGRYAFMVDGFPWSCPQDWAAKIHDDETSDRWPRAWGIN